TVARAPVPFRGAGAAVSSVDAGRESGARRNRPPLAQGMREPHWPTTDAIVEAASAAPSIDAYRARCLELIAPAVGCEAAIMQFSSPGAAMVRGGTRDFE